MDKLFFIYKCKDEGKENLETLKSTIKQKFRYKIGNVKTVLLFA
jgi:hypothetical protein